METVKSAREQPNLILRRLLILEGENEILKLIVDRTPLATVLDALVRLAERTSSSGLLASILLLDSDKVHLRHGAAPNLPEAYNSAIDGLPIGPTVGSCGTAAYLGRQVIVSDIQTDPLWHDFREIAAEHGLRACWSTPILASNKAVLGTFALYYRHACSPDELDQEVIEILTRTTALAIEHARNESELAISEERFRSLSRNVPMGVFSLDAHGTFTYVNPLFTEMAEYEFEKTFEYWIENATADTEQRSSLVDALSARTEFSGEFVLHNANRRVNMRITPIKTASGNFAGWVGSVSPR